MTDQLNSTNVTVTDAEAAQPQMVGKAHDAVLPSVNGTDDAVTEPVVGVAEPAPMKLLD